MLIVWVKVDDDLCIEVIDNGCGLFDEFIGSGLMNLWQWVEQVGGEFIFVSVLGVSGIVL